MKTIIISVEDFIVEVEGNWFDMTCIVLRDDIRDVSLVSYSQAVRIPTKYVVASQKVCYICCICIDNTTFKLVLQYIFSQKMSICLHILLLFN
jgi:hypothetical protein